MKRNIILMGVIVLIAACGGGDTSKDTKSETTTPATETSSSDDLSNNPDYKKGLAIEVKQDCATCHRIEERIQGPSYREIANKYAAAANDTIVDYLARKIMYGGSGVWGQIMMTPHPTLSEEEARSLAKYVLLMKK